MIELRTYQDKAIAEAMQALRASDAPVLLECSVGGGKSLLCGSIARKLEAVDKRVLCLVSSSELVRSNSEAFKSLGGNPSIFCASLNDKSCDQLVLFATPQSVIAAFKAKHPIADIIFNLIIIDEAHQINPHNHRSTYMRILRHYKQEYKAMRVLGMSGTAFRGSTSIVGDHAFFKTQVGNISTQYLIEQKFLVPPVFGSTKTESFDFSKCKAKKTGEFKGKDLQAVIDSKKRLTYDILQEVQEIMVNRDVCIIFCSTRAHCFEALSALPENQCRIILGDTPSDERNESLNLARASKIKYLISVNCLLVGVNVTNLDGLVWLRPTSSLLLYIQGIGRGLRLHAGKKDCLVLDYAHNIDTFQDFDNPIINEAIQPKSEEEQDYVIKCYTCNTLNSIHARRCIGSANDKRCDYYFTFKECTNEKCEAENDITARQCRLCGEELIDPNAKLQENLSMITLEVLNAKYWVTTKEGEYEPIIHVKYTLKKEKYIYESFYTKSEKAQRYTYGKFLKPHVPNYTKYYMLMSNNQAMKDMIASEEIKTPSHVTCRRDDFGKLVISRKLFD